MLLPALKLFERREVRVAVVQRNNQAKIDLVIVRVIKKTAALGVPVERPAERVHDQAFCVPLRLDFPDLLDTNAVVLRIGVGAQVESCDELLAEVTPDTLCENGVLAEQLIAGLVAAFSFAILADSHIARRDPGDPPVGVIQDLGRREAREQVDTGILCLLTQPLAEPAEADDEIPLVVHRARNERPGDTHTALRARQVVDVVAIYRGLDGSALRSPVGNQLVEARWFEHVAGEYVRANLRALFDDDDRQLCVELHQSQRRRQAGRAGADDDHVKFHGFAFVIF